MSPVTRKRLERNLAYHQAMADANAPKEAAPARTGSGGGGFEQPAGAHADAAKPAEGQPAPEARPRAATQRSASAAPAAAKPKTQQEVLFELHTEVVKQLREVLDAEPLEPAIITALNRSRPFRNTSADVRPQAGVWH